MDYTITVVMVALTALSWLLKATIAPELPEFAYLLNMAPLLLSVVTAARIAVVVAVTLIDGSGIFHTIVSIILYGTALLFWLHYGLEVDVINLLATSAVFAAVIGLSLQTSLGNLFSGMTLELEQPFRIGDYIRIKEREGRVEALKWRSVFIRTIEETVEILPYSALTAESIEVIAFDQPSRMTVKFHIVPSVAPVAVLSVVREVLNSGIAGVASEPSPAALFLGTDAQTESLVYALHFYSFDFMDAPMLKSRVMTRLWYALARKGIEMRAVSLFQPTDIEKPALPAAFNATLASAGSRAQFGPGETIPADLAGFVLGGSAREELLSGETDVAARLSILLEQTQSLQPKSLIAPEKLTSLSTSAIRLLGPVAVEMVERYGRLTDDPYLIYHALAKSIPAESDRDQFLASCPPRPTRHMAPGAPLGWAGLLGLEPKAQRNRVVNESADLLIIDRPGLKGLLKTMPIDEFLPLIASEPGLRTYDRHTLAETLRAVG